MILFFGLLRPYKGVEILLEAFRRVEGAELWVVGNPRMDVAPLRALAAGAGAGPLPHPFRRGRRDPGDLPPRRYRRPALPRRRALRRPLHRPRLRQADGAERSRRLPRGRGEAAPPASCRRGTPTPSPRRCGGCSATTTPAAPLAAAAAAARRRALLLGRGRPPDARPLRESCSRPAGRINTHLA